ncbi:MAG: hypothetical protein M1281_13345 [Chloroflexi bacterium]|nr:hypothetical protein [Chloroflexota bacterium]
MSVLRLFVKLCTAAMLCAVAGSHHADAAPRMPPGSHGETQAASASIDPVGYMFQISNETLLIEMNPDVAYNSIRSEYLVVWYNDRPGNDDIRARRIAHDGRLLGGPFYIAAGDPGVDRRYPRVAYNVKADQYMVVWQNQEISSGHSIHGRRISGTGQVLDASDIVIQGAGYNLYTPANPVIAYAYSSDKYLVVWDETWHPLPISTSIYGQKVLATGALEGGIISISQDPGKNPRTKADLAYNLGRNEYLVAWEQYDSGANLSDIYCRRVTGNGLPLFPETTQIAHYTVSATAPSVAALPVEPDGQYLVAWEVHGALSDWDIVGSPVTADGNPQPHFIIKSTNNNELQPAISGNLNRGRYLATWQQAPSTGFLFSNISGVLVSQSGSIVEHTISLGGFVAHHPRVEGGAHGDFLTVYDDIPLAADAGIYGRFAGNRTYIPAVTKP